MYKEVAAMLSKKNIAIGGIIIFLFIVVSSLKSLDATDTTAQIINHIDEILNANPLKEGEKFQLISVAQADTVALSLARFTEGFGLKPHFHKSHDETTYIIKGTGQIFINNAWVDVKPGNIHYNPMGKVHTTRNTGNEPLVFLSIFTPPMKERDMVLVE
jgi:mannose-6-phosphate isomerase-like protein (cupin superfamily)